MIRRLVFVLAFLIPHGAKAADTAEVHYMPFSLSTYHAITREGITGAAQVSAEVRRTDPRLLRVMLDIELAPDGPPLEKQFVRARIRFANGWTAYFDKTGGVQAPERAVSLNQATRDRVEMNLALLTGAETRGLALGWAIETARAFVERTTNWPRNDYSFCINHVLGLVLADRVIVQVIHHDDLDARSGDDGTVELGGGKSFELHFDPATKDLAQVFRYQ